MWTSLSSNLLTIELSSFPCFLPVTSPPIIHFLLNLSLYFRFFPHLLSHLLTSPLRGNQVETLTIIGRTRCDKTCRLIRNGHSFISSEQVVNRGDTYPAEVASTVLAVMNQLKFKYPYRLVWQSKVGPLPWLSPQTDDAMKGYAKRGVKNFVIIPIAFVNEHIETLHELDIEYGHDLKKEVSSPDWKFWLLLIRYVKLKLDHVLRVPTPNTHPKFIEGLYSLVSEHLNSNEVSSQQMKTRCPLCVNPACGVTRHWIKTISGQ